MSTPASTSPSPTPAASAPSSPRSGRRRSSPLDRLATVTVSPGDLVHVSGYSLVHSPAGTRSPTGFSGCRRSAWCWWIRDRSGAASRLRCWRRCGGGPPGGVATWWRPVRRRVPVGRYPPGPPPVGRSSTGPLPAGPPLLAQPPPGSPPPAPVIPAGPVPTGIEAARRLAAASETEGGPGMGVVVRLGADGCVILAPGDEPVHVPGFAVEALDSNGAGDAHVGAFLAALATGSIRSTPPGGPTPARLWRSPAPARRRPPPPRRSTRCWHPAPEARLRHVPECWVGLRRIALLSNRDSASVALKGRTRPTDASHPATEFRGRAHLARST